MSVDQYKLRPIFERYRDRTWYFLRPLGNFGDDLLFAGAEKLADELGLKWSTCETADFRSARTSQEHCIYLHGGGGYNSWSSGRAFVNLELAVGRQVPLVVQGPVTVAGKPEWLGSRFRAALNRVNCRELVFLAREDVTLGILRDLDLRGQGAVLARDDDSALALTADDLLRLAGLDAMPAGSYDLVALREDNEQPEGERQGAGRPPRGAVLDPARAARDFPHWLRIHLHARSITTNRLHSAIAGVIAGKPVALAPGSYHKNRAVFEASLRDRGARWIDVLERPRAPLWSVLPGIVRRSYKVRQLRYALQGVPLR